MTFSCRSVIPGCSHDPWLWKGYENWITSDAQWTMIHWLARTLRTSLFWSSRQCIALPRSLAAAFRIIRWGAAIEAIYHCQQLLEQLLLCICPVPTIFPKELSTFIWGTDVFSRAYRFSTIRSCMEPWDKNSRSQNINPLLSLAIRWRVASQHLVKMTRLSQKSWGCLWWSFLDDLLGFRDTLVLFCHWVVGVPCCVYRYRGYEARWDCMLNSCKSDLTRNEIP